MEKKNRLYWIDAIKSFAIVTVLLIHAIQEVYMLDPDTVNSHDLLYRVGVLSAFVVGRIGVPLFFMSTGYLLLGRDYTNESIVRFWKRNWLGLIITTEIWYLIYDIFLKYYVGKPIVKTTVIKNMLFIQPIDFTHNPTWYMPVIIGIYLFIPFVAILLKKVSNKVLIIPVAVVVFYSMVVPVADKLLLAHGKDGVYGLTDLNFSGGLYGVMLIMGYKACDVLSRIKTRYVVLFGMLNFAVTVLLQLVCYERGAIYLTWYDNVFLVLCTVCIFVTFSRKDRFRLQKLWGQLSKCSFGIYLIHKPIMTVVEKYSMKYSEHVNVAVLFAVVFAISWGTVTVISKIPKLNKILLYVK